ncbi:MAG: FHA domain-containing protein [Actinomycetota bacterium]
MSAPTVVLAGAGPGVDLDGTDSSWPIGRGVVIGRDRSCDVVFDVPQVSRRHVEIVDRAGRVGLRDLGSSNGTTVNGEPIDTTEVWLRNGDELVLGGAVALRFEDPAATPIAPRLGRLTGVWIDPDTEAVWVDARLVEPPLSSRQLALLRLLLDADGELVDRRRVVDDVWADVAADGVSDEAVAALIKRLRARLDETGRSGGLVDVVRGRGLRLVNPPHDG